MRQVLLGCSILTALAAASPAAASDPFVAQVMSFAGNFCPRGWAAMNGQLLPISQNTALFSLLGTNYGGNGQTTFALPTAKPVFTVTGAVLTQCIALQGVFPPRP